MDCRDGVAVIEGLHAFNPLLTDHLPKSAVLLVYAGMREEYCDDAGARVLATRDLRLARRITRDYLFRGHDADFTLNLWPHVISSETNPSRCSKTGPTWCWTPLSAASRGCGVPSFCPWCRK